MTKTPILTSYHTNLFPQIIFARPIPAWGEGEGAFSSIGEVTGEEAPSFEGLTGNDETAPLVVVPIAGTDQSKEVKTPAENPEAPEFQDEPLPDDLKNAAKEKEKPAQQPAEVKKEDKAPTEEEKAASKALEASEAAKKAEEDKAKAEKPAEYDADAELKKIDAVQLKSNATQKTLEGFNGLKEVAKGAVLKAKALAEELKAERDKIAAAPKEAAPEVADLQKKVEELEHYRATRELGEDPKLKAEYAEQVTKADDDLLNYCAQLGLKKEQADRLRQIGIESSEGQGMADEMMQALEKNKVNYLVRMKVQKLVENRFKVTEDFNAKLEGLKKEAPAFEEKKKAEKEAEITAWKTQLDKAALGNYLPKAGLMPKEAKDTDSAEVKAQVEAHNKRIKEELAPIYSETIGKLNERDPDTVARAAVAVLQNQELTKQLAAKDAEIAALTKRSAELEEMAKGVRRVQTRQASPAPETKLDFNTSREVSTEEAFENWEQTKKSAAAV